MSIKHFGLNTEPFGVTPDPRFLYFSSTHGEAIASLIRSIFEHRGIAMMLALPGMGKSTLLQYVREKLRARADVIPVIGSYENSWELLRAIMSLCGLQAEGRNPIQDWFCFQNFLLKQRSQGRETVLVFDEAQSLSYRTLQAICFLSNLETQQTKLLQIVLSARPEILEALKAPELESLRQRVSIFSRILPLKAAEVGSYIQQRLKVAGCEKPLFTPQAVGLITQYSRGIPRNINSICYSAMALCEALDKQTIDEDLIKEAARDVLVTASVLDPDFSSCGGRTEPDTLSQDSSASERLALIKRAAFQNTNGANRNQVRLLILRELKELVRELLQSGDFPSGGNSKEAPSTEGTRQVIYRKSS